MLDIKYVRENQEAVAEAMKNRNASWDAERFSSLDENRRAAIVKEEALQQERNAASKYIGEMMREGKKDEAEPAKERVREINDQLAAVSAKREAAEKTEGGYAGYDRTCRDLAPAEAAARIEAGEPHVWRLRVPALSQTRRWPNAAGWASISSTSRRVRVRLSAAGASGRGGSGSSQTKGGSSWTA